MSPENPDIRGQRLRQQRYRLVGEVCPHCEAKIFPPRDICPTCRNEATIEFQFSGKGTVSSFTTVYEAPAGYEDFAPYLMAWVKLDEGPMVTARLTDLDYYFEEQIIDDEPRMVQVFDVKIGMPVEMVTRILKKEGETGPISYGYVFRPPILQQKLEPACG